MRNPITFRTESMLGSVFVSIFSVFLISILIIEMKNFNSDIDTLDINNTHIKFPSMNERLVVKKWVEENNIKIPEGKGYRYLAKQYPDKPWFTY